MIILHVEAIYELLESSRKVFYDPEPQKKD